ncbi:MAG: glycosyltransferase [Bacteroidetes bacterium]|nr:glycosyltransferase [Bacteroidota bacterium]
MIDVSIVIVNYNVKDLVDNCISSIYKANNKNHKIEIFLVDNNSIDGSVKLIRNKYPEVNVIVNKSNIGFSKANNIALKKAQGKYILILNPDTVLEEGTFDKLISFYEKDSQAGAVTSKLILANGKLDYACKRSFPTLSVALPRMLGLSKLFPKSKVFAKYNLTYLDENETHEVDSICGAFMFIPANVLSRAGLFDEDYFMYGEDLDLCYRIKKNGYKVFYYPVVTTIHLKGASTQKTHLSYVNNFYGAMIIFIKKNFTGVPRILSFILQLGIIYRSVLSYSKRILNFLLQPIIDVILIYGSLILSVYLRFDIFPNKHYLFIITVYVLIWIFLLSIFGLYTRKGRLSLKNTFNAMIVGFFINSSITYFFKEYAFSRGVILASTIISLILLLLWRGSASLHKFIVAKNILLNKVNLLVVGEKELTQDIEEKLVSKYNILYFNKRGKNDSLVDLEETIQIENIHQVVFSGDHFSNQEILKTMWSFRNRNVQFSIVPSGKDLILSKLHKNIYDLSLLEIEYNINNKINIFFKRFFDIVLSFTLLITLNPFVYLYNALLKRDLSKHTSKLLLLPKVFSGKMSFIGIPTWFETSNKEYLGKKGLTGLIQLNYYDGISEDEMDNYNIFYAKNQSLIFDVEILLKTLFSFFKK